MKSQSTLHLLLLGGNNSKLHRNLYFLQSAATVIYVRIETVLISCPVNNGLFILLYFYILHTPVKLHHYFFYKGKKTTIKCVSNRKKNFTTILFQFCRDKEFGGYYAGKIDTKTFLLKTHTFILISCNSDLTTCRSVSLSC